MATDRETAAHFGKVDPYVGKNLKAFADSEAHSAEPIVSQVREASAEMAISLLIDRTRVMRKLACSCQPPKSWRNNTTIPASSIGTTHSSTSTTPNETTIRHNIASGRSFTGLAWKSQYVVLAY